MRSLIIVLLALTIGTTACSKKGSSSVATPPPVVTPDPDVTPDTVDSYGLSSDNIKSSALSGGYIDFSDYNPQARVAYFQFLHSAIGYGATLLSRYGVSNGYPYASGITCTNNYLDDVYYDFNFYPGQNQLNFANCTDYTYYVEDLALESAYVEMKLVDATTVEGNIHATAETTPNHFVTQIMVPFRGKITKVNLPGNRYFYEIAIGSKLMIYTDDNTTKPSDRALTIDFGNDEIGQVNLH